MNIIELPWSKELVDKLNRQQKSFEFHPYTCGICRDKLGIYCARNKKTLAERRFELGGDLMEDEELVVYNRELVATEMGWVCPTCDYRQYWY